MGVVSGSSTATSGRHRYTTKPCDVIRFRHTHGVGCTLLCGCKLDTLGTLPTLTWLLREESLEAIHVGDGLLVLRNLLDRELALVLLRTTVLWLKTLLVLGLLALLLLSGKSQV